MCVNLIISLFDIGFVFHKGIFIVEDKCVCVCVCEIEAKIRLTTNKEPQQRMSNISAETLLPSTIARVFVWPDQIDQ